MSGMSRMQNGEICDLKGDVAKLNATIRQQADDNLAADKRADEAERRLKDLLALTAYAIRAHDSGDEAAWEYAVTRLNGARNEALNMKGSE